MTNDLLLLSGNDIPFELAQVSIHQPTIKEIAYIGEQNFQLGCEFLLFTKDLLSNKDKVHLEKLTNFEIIMSMINDNSVEARKNRVNVQMIFSLLFPQQQVFMTPQSIVLRSPPAEEGAKPEDHLLDKDNWEEFQRTLKVMFCLDKTNAQGETAYNPAGEKARELAEKFKKAHEKIAKDKGTNTVKIAILSRYVSILAVGNRSDMNQLLNYTVYQINDLFHRYELKENWDVVFKARLAGAKDVKDADNWMDDIHPN